MTYVYANPDKTAVALKRDGQPDFIIVQGDKDWPKGAIEPYQPPVAPDITKSDVKAHAMRRILSIAPEWKQRNLNARATEITLMIAEGQTLDDATQNERATIEAIWASIAAIRAASDALEALDPIPLDYTDDNYWT